MHYPYITKFYVKKFRDGVITSVEQVPIRFREDVRQALIAEGLIER